MRLNPYILLLLLSGTVGISSIVSAQNNTYILNGNATQDKCNCYTLTKESEYQNGSVWNASKIDLTKSFDFVFNVNLGCRQKDGADGIAFILQPLSTSIGTYGEGMGFEGISPSIAITLDTYENPSSNDPYYDHIAIQTNGVITHDNDLAGPVPASAVSDHIEDCKWHLFRIAWDASAQKISAYFDDSLRVQATIDLVKTIFNNDPLVYWGFSAATGAAYNIQQFCTALNPDFKTSFANNIACFGNPVSFIDQSKSFTAPKNYYWDFGDGTTSTMANPPVHSFSHPGDYNVKLNITGMDGCISDTIEKIMTIADLPVSLFTVSDACVNKPPAISGNSTVKTGIVNKWKWLLDGSSLSNSQLPQVFNLVAGNHLLQLSVESNMGCISDTFSRNFTIRPSPVVDITAADNCTNRPIELKGLQTDNLTNVISWNWRLENGQTGSGRSITHSFSTPGIKNIQLTAAGDNGCVSDPVTKNIFINQVTVFAGNDTIIVEEARFQLKGHVEQTGKEPVNIKWSPQTGLDNGNLLTTLGTIPNNQVYTLSATTTEGCSAEDAVQVIIFKGSAVYVPTGFTPNHDGKNEMLKPYLVGIKQLYYFSLYNRWGQLIFSTAKMGEGWDGTVRGTEQPVGTYVWVLKAVDVMGNMYERKGTTTLIR